MDLKLWLKERELNARQIASRKTIADRSLWIEDANYFKAAYDAIQRAELQEQKPIDMVLHCPACGLQHVDAPDERTPGWVNEPHRSHLCHDCGHIWRPADVPTNGVAAVKTKGKADSPVTQAPNAQQAEPMCRIAKVKLADLIERGHSVCGVMIEKTHSDGKVTRGAVSNGGMVIWWHPEQMEAAHSNAQQAEAQEPVYWQWRRKADAWELNHVHTYRVFATADDSEVRELFDRPQPAQLQALSEGKILELIEKYWNDPTITANVFAQIVQSALAAKNWAVLNEPT